MTSVKVFDPAMCCSTGVCGPSVDPELARFAADLDWLAAQGVSVERFNLAQQPEAFVAHPAVTRALQDRGEDALPMVLVDGEPVSSGTYARREQLAAWTGVGAPPAGIAWSEALHELVAIGAAIGANCEPCLEHHVLRARELGVEDGVLQRAVAISTAVKEVPARHIEDFARSLVRPAQGGAPEPVPAGSAGGESCGCGDGGCC